MAVKKKFPYRAALVACGREEESRCAYGCTGCGACVAACKFGAIHLSATGPAQVAEERCLACGACVRACPQQIIRIHDCANPIVVKCANRDRGALAGKQCAVSCIGCGRCQRLCSAAAVQVTDNCAVIDEGRCLSCGMCAVNCPHGAIRDLRGILTAPM